MLDNLASRDYSGARSVSVTDPCGRHHQVRTEGTVLRAVYQPGAIVSTGLG